MVEFDDEFANPSDYARVYRALGLQVVPAHSPEDGGQWKRPLIEWLEFQDNLIPDALFERFYGPGGEHASRKNMGAIMGRASGGVFCVDLDEYKAGSYASFWWAGLLSIHNNAMDLETPLQVTGGGGTQRFFRAPAGWVPPTFKTPIGIDIRGQGGFAMLPPSRHASGRPYAWKPGCEPWVMDFAEAPPWLVEAIDELREEHGGEPSGAREHVPSAEAKNAFGLDIDDREHKLQVAVWGAVVDLYRESPIPPTEAVQEAELERLWVQYERTTKSRLSARPGLDNGQLLELEGRGPSELRRKWRYAMKRWDGKVREAAALLPPGRARQAATPKPDSPDVEDDEDGGGWFAASEVREEPASREWVVPDWIVQGAVNSMYGDPGLGKSLIATQLACSVSLGVPWLGLETKQGAVLGVFCEDKRDELERRVWSVKNGMGHCIGNPFTAATLWPRLGHDNLLLTRDRVSMALGSFHGPLTQALEAMNPALLILDTLADTFGGNEIDRLEVNYFLKAVLGGLIRHQEKRGHALTVLLLGHPSDSGRMDGGKGYSGSSAWNAGVRSRLYLSHPESCGPDDRLLTRGKANYASSGAETAIRLTWADGMFQPEGALPGDAQQARAAVQYAWAAIHKAWGSGGPFTTVRGHPRNVHQALVKLMTAEGFSVQTSRSAISQLLKEGRIGAVRRGGRSGLDVLDTGANEP